MILYKNNDALICKNFATTLQGEAQDWFHTLPPQSIRSFNELSFVFTKEYSSNRSIKRTSDHLFSTVKDPWETIRDYVKRFKAEKAKIFSCNEDIATTAFRNGLPIEHRLFEKLIMGEELTLAALYALAEKHALWEETKQSNKNELKKEAHGMFPDQRRLSTSNIHQVHSSNRPNSPQAQEQTLVRTAATYEMRSYQARSYKVLRIPSKTRPHYQRLLEVEAVL
ncbi:uncharacterized protein LOC125473448 [Pyrus x bretschneideri]|uniref:uncharacterized protein LOC125473448 n=1 Tax=Pyrus x bretschneideri TaxID=225117 RepID=UPI00202E309C|nr:uncharacterized protein LOC125473448 [Pyrus x bretschneideri]